MMTVLQVVSQQTKVLESRLSAVFAQAPTFAGAGGPICSPTAPASHSSSSRARAMALPNGRLASWICSYYHVLERDVEDGAWWTHSMSSATALAQDRAGRARGGRNSVFSLVLDITAFAVCLSLSVL